MADYLDPTDSVAVPRKTAPRPASLEGRTITLLDISKAKGDHLLDRIEELLRERARPGAIVRKKKPTFARPAPDALRAASVGATGAPPAGPGPGPTPPARRPTGRSRWSIRSSRSRATRCGRWPTGSTTRS